MLQMAALSQQTHDKLAQEILFPPVWHNMDELEDATNQWMESWLYKRNVVAKETGLIPQLSDAIDRIIRTDKGELLDDPDYPEAKKVRIIRGLHRLNQFYRSYHRFIDMLKPLFFELSEKYRRPVRLLELASGSGDLAMSIAKLAQKKNLPVQIVGSDYIEAYVSSATAKASKNGLPVTFEQIDAFKMNGISKGAYDIVLIAQAVHHFTPGQLAVMIAKSKQIATSAFVCIDAKRGLDNLVGPLPLLLLTLQFALLHDAWISGRRYYSQYELEHIAAIAAPASKVSTNQSRFPIGCTTVRFDS